MLEPLFDAELDYQPGMAPLTSDGDGTLIGSGDGAVHGPKLTGKLEWTLFEYPAAPCARWHQSPGSPPATVPASGSKAAATRPVPARATRRPAGLAGRRDPLLHRRRQPYSWLDGALTLWQGEFSEATHHARYTAFIQPTAPAS
jgi:hypothetical protein